MIITIALNKIVIEQNLDNTLDIILRRGKSKHSGSKLKKLIVCAYVYQQICSFLNKLTY